MNPFETFRKAGQTFIYLGIEMIVIEIMGGSYPSGDGGMSYKANQMKAEYVDDHGVVKTKIFDEEHIPILTNTNPPITDTKDIDNICLLMTMEDGGQWQPYSYTRDLETARNWKDRTSPHIHRKYILVEKF